MSRCAFVPQANARRVYEQGSSASSARRTPPKARSACPSPGRVRHSVTPSSSTYDSLPRCAVPRSRPPSIYRLCYLLTTKLPGQHITALSLLCRSAHLENPSPHLDSRSPRVENRSPRVENRSPCVESRSPRVENRSSRPSGTARLAATQGTRSVSINAPERPRASPSPTARPQPRQSSTTPPPSLPLPPTAHATPAAYCYPDGMTSTACDLWDPPTGHATPRRSGPLGAHEGIEWRTPEGVPSEMAGQVGASRSTSPVGAPSRPEVRGVGRMEWVCGYRHRYRY